MNDENRPLRALSLFSGCGGFCEGMKLAGFDVVTSVEWDRFACETFRFNFPETKLFEGDIADFNAMSKSSKSKEFGLDEIDVVFGGPPCQGYSQIGTRDLNDPRNQLYLEFVRAVKMYKPAVFVMENVPNMLLMKKGLFRDAIIAAFQEAGYSPVSYVLLSASDFGVPQDRRRVFFFGVRKDLEIPFALEDFVKAVLRSLKKQKTPTVWDALCDLPENVSDGSAVPYPEYKAANGFLREMRLDYNGQIYSKSQKLKRGISRFDEIELHNHHTKEIQEKRLALIKLLRPGCKASSLPPEIWNGARPEKWRRLHPDQVSHTVLAQMHRDLSEFVHPILHRWITVREAMRLQSFHDGFVFASSEWQQFKQVGNAVPPLLGRAVGLAARALVAEGNGTNSTEFEHLKKDIQLALF